jgi:hypothetical protein
MDYNIMTREEEEEKNISIVNQLYDAFRLGAVE